MVTLFKLKNLKFLITGILCLNRRMGLKRLKHNMNSIRLLVSIAKEKTVKQVRVLTTI